MSDKRMRPSNQNYIITDYFTNYEDVTDIPSPHKGRHHDKYNYGRMNI